MRRAVACTLGVLMAVAGPAWLAYPAHGTPPGENGRIAFAADDGSGFQIYTIDPDGTDLLQVTHLKGANNPDWSPDALRIAFARERRGDRSDIVVMDADGSHVHDLTSAGYKAQPSWSPDGHLLYYECDCYPQGIFVMQEDGSDRHRVTTHRFAFEPDSDPNTSPDGRTVTFVRHQQDGLLQALLAVDANGAHIRRLVPYEREVAVKHDWAPDGRHIVLTVNADYPHGRSPNVATIRSDGSHLRMLTHFRGGKKGAFAGSYSPNGQWIVFRIENVTTGMYKLAKMHPDGSHRTLIARLPFAPRGNDWGPRP